MIKKPLLLWRLLLSIYSAAIFMLIFLLNTHRFPLYRLIAFPFMDLGGHFFLYGFLSFLLHKSLNEKKISLFKKIDLPLGGVIITALTIIEEFSQRYIPGRTFSLVDLFFGFGGIFIFTFLQYRIKRERRTITLKISLV